MQFRNRPISAAQRPIGERVIRRFWKRRTQSEDRTVDRVPMETALPQIEQLGIGEGAHLGGGARQRRLRRFLNARVALPPLVFQLDVLDSNGVRVRIQIRQRLVL